MNGCSAFRSLVLKYQQAFRSGSLTTAVRQLLDEINYMVELRSRYDNPDEREAREASVEQIVNAMSVYEEKKKKTTLLGFLDEIALANQELENDKEKQLKRNSVSLMTMHSAKGLEFPRVYVVGLEEGILPHHRSIKDESGSEDQVEEERRLCYVGVTRAEEHLTLSLALSRRKWGKPRPTDASRFLFEMTGQAEKFVPNRSAQSPKARLAAARKKTETVRKRKRTTKRAATTKKTTVRSKRGKLSGD